MIQSQHSCRTNDLLCPVKHHTRFITRYAYTHANNSCRWWTPVRWVAVQCMRCAGHRREWRASSRDRWSYDRTRPDSCTWNSALWIRTASGTTRATRPVLSRLYKRTRVSSRMSCRDRCLSVSSYLVRLLQRHRASLLPRPNLTRCRPCRRYFWSVRQLWDRAT